MTDNEVIYCFQNGCSLLNSDDVDSEDLIGIRRELEKCAQNMLPYIHKYITKKKCKNCKNNKNNKKLTSYIECKFRSECMETIERAEFVMRKGE